MDLGTVEVPCPKCGRTLVVFVRGEESTLQDGALSVEVGPDQALLDAELEAHAAECH